jgi:hypothetical protein
MNATIYRGGIVVRCSEEPDGRPRIFIAPDDGVMSPFSLDMVVTPEAVPALTVGRHVVISVETRDAE